VTPGFKREELKARYDVARIVEDEWHSYSGKKTAAFIREHLSGVEATSKCLLNAGAGIYELRIEGWKEISVDLFAAPMRRRPCGVCGSVERLPFRNGTFGAVVCVGEVLAYCDPVRCIREFARVLAPSGVLICDFGNSRSLRYWFKAPYGRAADLVTDWYNGAPERTWVYDPDYVRGLLISAGFRTKQVFGTHTWSALAKRVGVSTAMALNLQRCFEWLHLPSSWACVTTIVAARAAIGK
jgi:SAM-dependent methyltransferase